MIVTSRLIVTSNLNCEVSVRIKRRNKPNKRGLGFGAVACITGVRRCFCFSGEDGNKTGVREGLEGTSWE